MIKILQCAYHAQLSSWQVSDFCAPYWRLYHNVTAGAVIVGPGFRLELTPDRVWVIPPEFSGCRGELTRPVSHFVLHFVAAAPFDRIRPQVYDYDAGAFLPLIDRIRRKELNEPQYQLGCQSLVAAALARLPSDALPAAGGDPVVDRVLRLINAAPTAEHDPRRLAAGTGVALNEFRRRFKVATGYTLREYLLLRRLREAALLLHFSRLSIDEIAAQCGFCDRFYLSRQFRRHRGLSPAAFRRGQCSQCLP